jgi:prenyltransferase beta subunit
MSLRLEMLQIARLAPQLLGESTPLVMRFFQARQMANGLFQDRQGQGDLYYTVFGLEGLMALSVTPETAALRNTLLEWRDTPPADLVHLCCLARAWAWVEGGIPPALAADLAARLARYRAADGGFSPEPGAAHGTAYACYLAVGAYQDLGQPVPEAERILDCLTALRTPDGGWTNTRASRAAGGATNPTAAALAVLRQLDQPPPSEAADWLFGQAHPQGGFRATPQTPLPDLLSTATALHALAGLDAPLPPPLKERCLDFVDSLWTNEGGFHGHWADDALDCEYTWYGLLALGHLSL